MVSVCKEWPGEVTIVNGRLRNPKHQGLVKQGNRTVEKMLGVRLHEAESDLPQLPVVQCEHPYELVFGQPPKQSIFPGAKVGSQIWKTY